MEAGCAEMAYLNQKQRETQLLTVVADYQPVTVREIASHMRVAYSTAARFVRQLATRKVIRRCDEPRWPAHWKTTE